MIFSQPPAEMLADRANHRGSKRLDGRDLAPDAARTRRNLGADHPHSDHDYPGARPQISGQTKRIVIGSQMMDVDSVRAVQR